MSKKPGKDLMKLDFYDILEIKMNSDEKEIKKSYRKKALKCHPDKNPDNPDAAMEFDQLKKILEILLDPGARRAYDKVLKARKAAAIRARESDAKSQKLKSELEERERRAQAAPRLSEEERFRRELKRLEEEGKRIIEEELERLNKVVKEELKRGASAEANLNQSQGTTSQEEPLGHKIKVKWIVKEDSPGYTEKEIHQLFYKWGDINALVMKQKKNKGTALIDYKLKTGADMAVKFEKGQIGRPVEVVHIIAEPPKETKPKTVPEENKTEEKGPVNYDYESIAAMNQRRQDERRKLIEDILKEESKV